MARKSLLRVYERRLLVVWLVGVLPSFLALFVRTITVDDASFEEYYGQPVSQVWAWFSALVLPTLGLIMGTIVAQARDLVPSNKMIERFYYRLALGLSVVYLMIVNVVVLGSGVFSRYVDNLLSLSGLGLAFAQALLDAALGTIFISARRANAPGEKGTA